MGGVHARHEEQARTQADEPIWFSENLELPVCLALLNSEISTARYQLPDFHGDPDDRIIVATAITLGIPLITTDKKIIRWNENQILLQVTAI